MPEFTVSSGGGSNLEDGVYTVTLVNIKGDPTDPENSPKMVTARSGPKAGQEIGLWDWYFAVDDGGPFDGETIQASTSVSSGPKSKMYAFLTALLGGKAPEPGQTFKNADLYGRRALATIRKDENGWPRIENLGAIPRSMLQQEFARVTGAPTQGSPLNGLPVGTAPAARRPVAAGAAAPLRDQVAAEATEDSLPF